MRYLNFCGEVQRTKTFQFNIGLLAYTYLDCAVGSAFAYKPEASWFNTRLYQLNDQTVEWIIGD